MVRHMRRPRMTRLNVGRSFGIFEVSVKAIEKGMVTTKPKVFKTRKQAKVFIKKQKLTRVKVLKLSPRKKIAVFGEENLKRILKPDAFQDFLKFRKQGFSGKVSFRKATEIKIG